MGGEIFFSVVAAPVNVQTMYMYFNSWLACKQGSFLQNILLSTHERKHAISTIDTIHFDHQCS